MHMPGRGLYAITAGQTGTTLSHRVAGWLRGGARVIQYRDKSGNTERRQRDARELLKLCREAGAPLLINDDVGLAAMVGADGVHLGHEDTDIHTARQALGPHAIIGVSCYNQLERARQAVADGADYVAFGSVFVSDTKPDAVRAELSLLSRARQQLPCPIVAIGGITPDNGAAVMTAGADLLAVIGGLQQGNPEHVARRYGDLFNGPEEQPEP